MKEYTIDATNRTIGRVATEAAVILMGKNDPSFRRNTTSDAVVTITNASKVKIDSKKPRAKVYQRYSGYPGGQKQRTLEETVTVKGYKEVFEKAVYGMLPANKLRRILMKNLIVTD